MAEVIEIKDMSKTFRRKKVLEKVNLTINSGEIVGILGGSGSGKSVLLKTILGFYYPTTGIIKIYKKVGFSTQDNSLYESLTLQQNLDYFSRVYNIADGRKKIDFLIELLQLEEYRKTIVKNLSGGTKKRLDIACALLEDPEILILDEPFVGLDSFLVSRLSEFLKSLQKKGNTIIFSSHILNQVETLCNRLFFVEKNTVKEINKSQLKELYKKL